MQFKVHSDEFAPTVPMERQWEADRVQPRGYRSTLGRDAHRRGLTAAAPPKTAYPPSNGRQAAKQQISGMTMLGQALANRGTQ